MTSDGEQYELEHLLGTDTNVLKALTNQALTESVGEGFTSLANTAADLLVMQDKSQLETAVRYYEEQGLSRETAAVRALGDALIDIGWDMTGGGLSGGVMGTGAAVIRNVQHGNSSKGGSSQVAAVLPGDMTAASTTGSSNLAGNAEETTGQKPEMDAHRGKGLTAATAAGDTLLPGAMNTRAESPSRDAAVRLVRENPGYRQIVLEQMEAGFSPEAAEAQVTQALIEAIRDYFFPQKAGAQTGQTLAQTPGTTHPGMQTQVPGESQPNAQAQTEKGQPLSPEKRIADLATDIKKSGLTTGKATIAAQEMVTEAEKRFGANSDAVLDAYQPGQNPRQFLNGFQNAYILGTQGNQAALQNSKAAAYLTQDQKKIAYSMGTKDGKHPTNKVGDTSDAGQNRKRLLSVLNESTIENRKVEFMKAFQSGQISTRISPQKQARHIQGTKQFLEHDKKLSARGDHPSYIKENLTQEDLQRLVIDKLKGDIRDVPGRYYEYVQCEEPIGFYYSRSDGKYMETCRAQVAYAVAEGNIHVIPVMEKNIQRKETGYA